MPDGESAVKSSYCLVPARLLQTKYGDRIRAALMASFKSTLKLDPTCYGWRFVPEGSVLVEYDDKPPFLADEDYVEVEAIQIT